MCVYSPSAAYVAGEGCELYVERGRRQGLVLNISKQDAQRSRKIFDDHDHHHRCMKYGVRHTEDMKKGKFYR